MSVEFVISSQSFYDSGLLVSNCSFHPHEPVLACAVEHGKVFLYHQDVAPQTVGSIVPLSKWKETVLNPVSTQYPVSNATCLQWDVSFSFEIVIWLTFSPDSCYVFELKKKKTNKNKADGRRLAVGYENGTLILWSRDGCRLFERRKHTASIGSIRWNPIQLNVFASGSNDRVLFHKSLGNNGSLARDISWMRTVMRSFHYLPCFLFIFFK